MKLSAMVMVRFELHLIEQLSKIERRLDFNRRINRFVFNNYLPIFHLRKGISFRHCDEQCRKLAFSLAVAKRRL